LDFCVEEGRFALLITREAIRNVYEKKTQNSRMEEEEKCLWQQRSRECFVPNLLEGKRNSLK
jgi:hypothetical protein